jgi:hypothetical protein
MGTVAKLLNHAYEQSRLLTPLSSQASVPPTIPSVGGTLVTGERGVNVKYAPIIIVLEITNYLQ